jgi:hypothetical protein
MITRATVTRIELALQHITTKQDDVSVLLQSMLRQARLHDDSAPGQGNAPLGNRLFPNSSVARLYDHNVEEGKPGVSSPSIRHLVQQDLYQTLQIKAQASTFRRSCKPWCSCACHKQKTLRNPEWLRRVFGGLFMGYTGLPILAEPCSEANCQQRSAPSIEITYHFPVWFLARVLSFNMKFSTFGGPELILRMPRMVNWATPLWRVSYSGDLESVQKMFRERTGSPFDVNAYGQSALHVSRYNASNNNSYSV